MRLQGYQVTSSGWASGGHLIESSSNGLATADFAEPSGTYDVQMVLRDANRESAGLITIKIGNHRNEYRFWTRQNGGILTPIFQNIQINNGEKIIIECSSGPNQFSGVDFIEFIPSSSRAWRAKATERTFRYLREYRAIGWDEMNLHITLLKIVPVYFLTCFLFHLLTGTTPGFYVLRLQIVKDDSTQRVVSATGRLTGDVINFCSLGILWYLFIRLHPGQTVADIWSRSFITSLHASEEGFPGFKGARTTFNAIVFSRKLPEQVPISYRLAAFLFDIVILTSIMSGIRLAIPLNSSPSKVGTVFIPIEDFTLTDFQKYVNIYSLRQSLFTPNPDSDSARATTTFKGPSGFYKVRVLNNAAKKDVSFSVKIGKELIPVDGRFSASISESPRYEFDISPFLYIKTDDPIAYQHHKGEAVLEGLAFEPQPSNEVALSFIEHPYGLTGLVRAVTPVQSIPSLVILLSGYVLLVIISPALSSVTPGSWLAGFRYVVPRDRTRSPYITECLIHVYHFITWPFNRLFSRRNTTRYARKLTLDLEYLLP